MRFLLILILFGLTTFAVIAGQTQLNLEPFDDFFHRFTTNKEFAISRTSLPLEFLKWEYGADENGNDESRAVTSYITLDEYQNWDNLSTVIQNNSLTYLVLNDAEATSNIQVKIFKANTDWLIIYHFRHYNGQWHLWRCEDMSL